MFRRAALFLPLAVALAGCGGKVRVVEQLEAKVTFYPTRTPHVCLPSLSLVLLASSASIAAVSS